MSALSSSASLLAPAAVQGAVRVTADVFGAVGGQQVQRFTLSNAANVSVQLITLGAIITSIKVPDREGRQQDVVLGFDGPQGYAETKGNKHFGAILGRVANRISNASFTLDGKFYQLNANSGNMTSHGGVIGWNLAIWNASVHSDGVTFSLLSPDGDERFPGAVLAQATYRLTADGRLLLHMQAISSKPTPINMVNHSYFNLAGHSAGPQGVFRTRLAVKADRYTVQDEHGVPTGAIKSVVGTPYDLRSPRLLGDLLPKVQLDNNLVVTRDSKQQSQTILVARASDDLSGRFLEVYSDQPGIQVYTANGLPDGSAKPAITGKGGAQYLKYGAFCLETQNFPDAIHHQGIFPNSVLRPDALYEHHVVYKFGVSARGYVHRSLKQFNSA